jgi:hypothetical protein
MGVEDRFVPEFIAPETQAKVFLAQINWHPISKPAASRAFWTPAAKTADDKHTETHRL